MAHNDQSKTSVRRRQVVIFLAPICKPLNLVSCPVLSKYDRGGHLRFTIQKFTQTWPKQPQRSKTESFASIANSNSKLFTIVRMLLILDVCRNPSYFSGFVREVREKK